MPIQFVPGEREGNPRWFPQGGVEFPPEQWVDELIAVGDTLDSSPTYHELRARLGEAILLVTARDQEAGMIALRNDHMEASRYGGLLARFKMAETSGVFVPTLSFLRTSYEGGSGPLSVEFPSPRPGQRNASLAIAERVVSRRAHGATHTERVRIKDLSERIGPIAELAGWGVVEALVDKLDSQNPSYKLRKNLSKAYRHRTAPE